MALNHSRQRCDHTREANLPKFGVVLIELTIGSDVTRGGKRGTCPGRRLLGGAMSDVGNNFFLDFILFMRLTSKSKFSKYNHSNEA